MSYSTFSTGDGGKVYLSGVNKFRELALKLDYRMLEMGTNAPLNIPHSRHKG